MNFSFLRLPLVLAAAALSLAQTASPPAQSGVTLRTTTTLVQLSVAAHDSKGRAVTGAFSVDNLVRAGDQVVPVSLTVPVATLDRGGYRLEVKAMRSPGVASAIRLVDFDVE